MSDGAATVIESRTGVWWTDGDSNRRVPGTLARADDLWQLDLIGNLPVNNRWTGALSMVPPTTIYGSCLGTRYTLRWAYLAESKGPSLHFGKPQDDHDQAEDQYWQRWTGETLLKGGALAEDFLFGAAQFELTGLSSWWPQTGLSRSNKHNREVLDYDWPEQAVANCGDGLVLTIGTNVSESMGIRDRTMTERVIIGATCETGFTLEALEEQVIVPLRGLLAISMKNHTEYFNCQLQPLGLDEHPTYPIHLDPEVIDAQAESNPRNSWPTFTTEDIDIPQFLPAWLKLAKDNALPLAVAEPHTQSGTLQSQVVEAVNAAETLHRTLTGDTAVYPFAEMVMGLLKADGKLNSAQRRSVYSAIKLTEVPLEARLLGLAEGLGEPFCAWFFNGRVRDWARVAATVRNALSHGYPTRHRIEDDTGALIGILEMTRTVIRLRLLCAAGLPSGDPLEVLLAKDQSYLALMKQTIADWRELAARTRT
jgi:ApeA N-terminal domain 1